MTLLDTHVWFWWITGDERLGEKLPWLDARAPKEIGISVFSIWEVAKLHQLGRIQLPIDLTQWIQTALAETMVQVIPITPHIAIEANCLPGDFHKDPADQIITATARTLDCPLLTADTKILSYPHVRTLTL